MVSICAMSASWGLFLWIPTLLSLSPEQGGAGLGIVQSNMFLLVMYTGSFAGYLTFGALADRFSHKKIYISYVFLAAVLVPIYSATRDPMALLFIGPLIGFFGAGHFAGFGIITSELFPTHIRGNRAGVHLQHRAGCQRPGALHDRQARGHVRVHGRVPGDRRDVPADGHLPVPDAGNPRKEQRLNPPSGSSS